jgi:hypothetical protein
MSSGTRCWWRAGRSGGGAGVGICAGHGPQVCGAGGRSRGGGRGRGRCGRRSARGSRRCWASRQVDGRQAAADGHAAARVAGGGGPSRRRHARQGGGRGVEAPAPRGLRAADVSAGRSGRGRLLRGAGRRRRDAAQGLAVPDAADVLRPRLRVDLRAPGSGQLSRRARPGLRALRRRARPRGLRQSARRRRADPGRRRAHPDPAVRRARLALSARACFCRPGEGHDKGGVEARGKAVRQQALVPIPSGPTLDGRSTTRCWPGWTRGSTTTRDAAGQTIGALRRGAAPLPAAPPRLSPEATTLATVTPRALVRLEGAVYSVWCRWAGLDLVVRVGASTVTIVGRDGTRVAASAEAIWQRSIDYRHYLAGAGAQAASRAPGAAGSAARSGRAVSRDLGAAPRAHGPRDAARLFAKVLGQLETQGAAVVVPALTAALATGTPLLLALTPAGGAPPVAAGRGAGAPPRHRRESGCAADYDGWLSEVAV